MKGLALATAAVLAAAGVANAQTWDELINGGGDAGDLLGTAQVPVGVGPLTMITGLVLAGGDADLFLIHIDDPANFSAQAWPNTTFDTPLWLFDLAGYGVTFNDDDVGLQSRITGQFVPAAGDYYLAISQYDWDALDAGGLELWLDTPYNVERAPDGPGAANPLASWGGSVYSDGNYEILLTGVSYVPAPGAMALLGLAFLAGRRRR